VGRKGAEGKEIAKLLSEYVKPVPVRSEKVLENLVSSIKNDEIDIEKLKDKLKKSKKSNEGNELKD